MNLPSLKKRNFKKDISGQTKIVVGYRILKITILRKSSHHRSQVQQKIWKTTKGAFGFVFICLVVNVRGLVESWDTFTYFHLFLKITGNLPRNTKQDVLQFYYLFSLFTSVVQQVSTSLFPRRHIVWCWAPATTGRNGDWTDLKVQLGITFSSFVLHVCLSLLGPPCFVHHSKTNIYFYNGSCTYIHNVFPLCQDIRLITISVQRQVYLSLLYKLYIAVHIHMHCN